MPLCALLSHVNPISALFSSHFVGDGSLIQCAVTAKYASVLLACHASHVKLTSPETVGPFKIVRKETQPQERVHVEFGFQSNQMALEQLFDLAPDSLLTWKVGTMFCPRSNVDHCLELGMFYGLNGLQSKIRSVKQDIYLYDRMAYLVRGHKPLNCCLMEGPVRVGDNLFRDRFLLKIVVQSMGCLICSVLALPDIAR
jgi:hypothetical protein